MIISATITLDNNLTKCCSPCVKQLLVLFGLLALFLAIPLMAKASSLQTDLIRISTATGSSDGITFSSYVVLSSDLALTGPVGYITASSSVTASAFWGDGRSLSGVGTLFSSGTYSGSNTFLSTFTIRSAGRDIVLSTSATIDTIKISGSGTLSFNPELHNSSHTLISAYSTTQQSFGACVPGSTVTIRTTGGKVEAIYILSLSHNASGTASIWTTLLQDDGYSAPKNSDSLLRWILGLKTGNIVHGNSTKVSHG